MPTCAVKLCKNNSSRNKKDTGITYHLFPADPIIYDRWVAKVRLSRQECWWKPGKRSILCSAHFNESDMYITKGGLKRLCKGAVPQNALFLSSIPPDIFMDTVTAELNTSVPVVDTNKSTVTVDPSPSVPVGDSNHSAVVIEPIISVSVDEGTIITTGSETPPPDDYPEIDCLFDSSSEIKLKRELRRKHVLQLKHARIIKTLKEKTRRLKNANSSLKSIIKSLKLKLLKMKRSTQRFQSRTKTITETNSY